jgi:hypothetical protein
LIGPDLRINNLRCHGQGRTDGVPMSWTWQLRIRNEGSRSGEIRNTRVDVFEIRPDMNPRLAITYCYPQNMDGLYEKGKAQNLILTIAYKNPGPDTHLTYRRVEKLIAILRWEKETRNGFTQDDLRLTLVPEPKS